jgi:predicted CoA-binding protein
MPTPRSIVVLGASRNPARYSNMLVRRLKTREDYTIVPVNPAQEDIEGLPVSPSLSSLPANPDLLTLYVSPSHSEGLAPEIVRLNPGRVIFNPGAENPRLEAALNAAGITTENACSLVLLSQNEL